MSQKKYCRSSVCCVDISILESEELNDDVLGENRCFQELETRKTIFKDTMEQYAIFDVNTVAETLKIDGNDLSVEEKKYIRQLKCEINSSQVGWMKMNRETNVRVLVMLLYDWLECLRSPVVGLQTLENIVVLYKQPEACFEKFNLVGVAVFAANVT